MDGQSSDHHLIGTFLTKNFMQHYQMGESIRDLGLEGQKEKAVVDAPFLLIVLKNRC